MPLAALLAATLPWPAYSEVNAVDAARVSGMNYGDEVEEEAGEVASASMASTTADAANAMVEAAIAEAEAANATTEAICVAALSRESTTLRRRVACAPCKQKVAQFSLPPAPMRAPLAPPLPPRGAERVARPSAKSGEGKCLVATASSSSWRLACPTDSRLVIRSCATRVQVDSAELCARRTCGLYEQMHAS